MSFGGAPLQGGLTSYFRLHFGSNFEDDGHAGSDIQFTPKLFEGGPDFRSPNVKTLRKIAEATGSKLVIRLEGRETSEIPSLG